MKEYQKLFLISILFANVAYAKSMRVSIKELAKENGVVLERVRQIIKKEEKKNFEPIKLIEQYVVELENICSAHTQSQGDDFANGIRMCDCIINELAKLKNKTKNK